LAAGYATRLRKPARPSPRDHTFVVNKADSPDAERTEHELRAMLALRRQEAKVPVLKTVATSGAGVAMLADWLEKRDTRSARPPFECDLSLFQGEDI